MDFSASIKIKFLICAVIIIILAVGLYFRIAQNNPLPFLTNNVVSYYFNIAERFNLSANFPAVDIWRFAPSQMPENVPPFLPYFTVYFYKLIKIFYAPLSFLAFAFWLPVVIFSIWAVSGFFLIKKIFNSFAAAFIFLLLLAFLPISIQLTKFGHYTEEFLGVFLIFLAFLLFALWLREKKFIFLISGLVFTTFFVLTWQQFLLVYGIYALAAISKLKKKKEFLGIIFLAVGSFLLAQAASTLIFHSAYSPFSMLREAYFGILHYNSEFIQIAMWRSDWAGLNFSIAIQSFNLFGWMFWFIGLFFALFQFKRESNSAVLIANLCGLAVAIIFAKSKFLFLPFFLVLGSLGGNVLIKNKSVWIGFAARLNWLASKIKIAIILGIILILVAGFLGFKSDWFFKSGDLPKPEISFYNLPVKMEVGHSYRIGLEINNRGGRGLRENSAFGGLHIEVENAEVRDIGAYSPFTAASVIVKPDAQRDNIYWFETEYNFLDKEQWGRVEFTLIPKKKSVNIWYRGWMPGFCLLINRIRAFNELGGAYKDFFKNSWRSENCIVRVPANNSENESLCQIKVFAAKKTQQNFRCLLKIL